MKTHRVSTEKLYLFLISELDGGRSLPSHSGRFISGKYPGTNSMFGADWAPEPFWMFWGTDELLVSIGVRKPDGPARSKSLDRPS